MQKNQDELFALNKLFPGGDREVASAAMNPLHKRHIQAKRIQFLQQQDYFIEGGSAGQKLFHGIDVEATLDIDNIIDSASLSNPYKKVVEDAQSSVDDMRQRLTTHLDDIQDKLWKARRQMK